MTRCDVTDAEPPAAQPSVSRPTDGAGCTPHVWGGATRGRGITAPGAPTGAGVCPATGRRPPTSRDVVICRGVLPWYPAMFPRGVQCPAVVPAVVSCSGVLPCFTVGGSETWCPPLCRGQTALSPGVTGTEYTARGHDLAVLAPPRRCSTGSSQETTCSYQCLLQVFSDGADWQLSAPMFTCCWQKRARRGSSCCAEILSHHNTEKISYASQLFCLL